MHPYVKVLHEHLKLVEATLEKRKDFPVELFLKDREMPQNSPVFLFSHAINNLYYYSHTWFNIASEIDYIDLFEDIEKYTIHKKCSENYLLAINAFEKMIENEKFNYSELEDKLAYTVAHIVQHVGQGLRIHKMNIADIEEE